MLLILTYLGGEYLKALIFLLVLFGMWEFANFFKQKIYWDYLLLAGLSLLFLSYSNMGGSVVLIWLGFQLMYFLIRVTFTSRDPFVVAYNLLGVFYTAGLFSFLWLIREQFGFWWLFYAFLVTWLTDTGAYFIGLKYGKHNLAPTISPKKSIEGAIGGLGVATLGGIIFALIAGESVVFVTLLSIVLSIFGQIGDLVESGMKRARTVKDSGSILPGHGGILDRFDSLVFVLPVLYFALTILK